MIRGGGVRMEKYDSGGFGDRVAIGDGILGLLMLYSWNLR